MSFLKRLFGKRDEGNDQWQLPIVQELCVAMIRQVPDHWSRVAIVLEVTDQGLGSGLSHSAIIPDPTPDAVVRNAEFVGPDMAVFAATRKLELGWLEHRKTFKRAIISAKRDSQGDWDFRSDYEHE